MNKITKFWGKHFFLSNHYLSPVVFENETYRSVENAYQAGKTLDPELRKKFAAYTPGEAKRFSKNIRVRNDWETVKYDIMLDLLEQKFNNPKLQAMLLETNDAILIEGNTWNDTIWGCVLVEGEWVGQNRLGKMLMRIRLKYVAKLQRNQ